MALAVVHKFGHNADIDISSAPEDVWDAGGVYAFPSAAAATTILSDNANDTADGTGARTVEVFGVDSNYLGIQETVILAGAAVVTLTNQFLRVFRAIVRTAGSNLSNAGVVDVRHGATNLARILADVGQTQMAIYTVPVDFINGQHLLSWYASVHGAASIDAVIWLQVREFGAAFRAIQTVGLRGNPLWMHDFNHRPIRLPARTDIRVRVASTTVDNTAISAGFALDDGGYRG